MTRLLMTVVLPPNDHVHTREGKQVSCKDVDCPEQDNLEFMADEVQYLSSGVVIKSDDEQTGASWERFIPYGEFIMIEVFKEGTNKTDDSVDDLPF